MAKTRKVDWADVTSKIKASEKSTKTYGNEDPLAAVYYTPKLKDDGSFQAVIRFLPRPEDDGDGVPFVKVMNHGFSEVGGWFIENCPTTVGDKCPVCEDNGKAWKSGDQKTASVRGRRTSFYSNILVVNDVQTPENNGKVFVFRYGKKIQDKIIEKLAPADGSIDEPVEVFDYVKGQNFKLKISKLKTVINGRDTTYNNYDQSAFTGTASPVAESEKDINAIDASLHNLGVLTSPDKFKSYDELKKLYLGKIGQTHMADSDDTMREPVSKRSTFKPTTEKVTAGFSANDASDDDFFAQLREEG